MHMYIYYHWRCLSVCVHTEHPNPAPTIRKQVFVITTYERYVRTCVVCLYVLWAKWIICDRICAPSNETKKKSNVCARTNKTRCANSEIHCRRNEVQLSVRRLLRDGHRMSTICCLVCIAMMCAFNTALHLRFKRHCRTIHTLLSMVIYNEQNHASLLSFSIRCNFFFVFFLSFLFIPVRVSLCLICYPSYNLHLFFLFFALSCVSHAEIDMLRAHSANQFLIKVSTSKMYFIFVIVVARLHVDST